MAIASDSPPVKLPEHVAIIMDGNGRWAKARGKNRLEGHKQGVTSALNVIEAAAELGIKYLTLYTFSTENWNRPDSEVAELMNLLVLSVDQYTPHIMKKGVKIKFIGQRQALSSSVRTSMANIENKTSENKTITVILAVNYGGRQEIVETVRHIALQVTNGAFSVNDISEKLVSDHLFTRGIPDPDLLIRTSGEMRLSNFLLWQLSYAEFYITHLFWPDFSKKDFKEAVDSYQGRLRRFGGV